MSDFLLPGKLASKPVSERVQRLHFRILKLDFRDISVFDNDLIKEILETLVPLFRGTSFVGVIAELRDAKVIETAPTQTLLDMMKDNLFAMAWHVPSSDLYREGRKLQLTVDPVVPTRIVASRLEAIDFITRIGMERDLISEQDRASLVDERLNSISQRMRMRPPSSS